MIALIATLRGIIHYIAMNAEENKLINVAMSIVRGNVYYIDGNLYGPSINIAEHLAEEVAEAGQILAYSDRPDEPYERFSEVVHIDTGLERVFCIKKGPYMTIHPRFLGSYYPAPYSQDFIRVLDTYRKGGWNKKYRKVKEKKFLAIETVAFISLKVPKNEEKSIDEESAELVLLETLSLLLRAKNCIAEELHQRKGREIKTPGGISIVAFPDAFEALIFARKLLFEIDFLDICIACGKGPVIIHRLNDGAHDIDGSEVNFLSKMAEDRHETGCIYFTPLIREEAKALWGKPISFTISGVTIETNLYRRGEEKQRIKK